jgi:hypothetical protein
MGGLPGKMLGIEARCGEADTQAIVAIFARVTSSVLTMPKSLELWIARQGDCGDIVPHARREVDERALGSKPDRQIIEWRRRHHASVSTCTVKAITEEPIGHSFSASSISAAAKKLDGELARFAHRRLNEAFPYLILDARSPRFALTALSRLLWDQLGGVVAGQSVHPVT